VLGAALACQPSLVSAEKTDRIILRNGDRITGEVKGLARGKLDYSTDDAGRLSIEWDKVAKVTSPNPYEIELGSGAKYFGRLSLAARDGFIVVEDVRSDTLRTPSVVGITPLNAGFLQRIMAYLDVGFTLAKANQATTFSLSGAADYRGPAIGSQFKYDSYAQGQETVPTTTRNSLRGTVSWFLPQRWSAVALVQVEQNDELALDYRFTGGGGMNRSLVHTNDMELSAALGVAASEERFSSELGAVTNTSLEGLVAGNWSAYRFDSPALDFSTSVALFPSFSDWGRLRGQVEFRLKYEVFSDFHAGILFTDTFDSRPPESVSKNDYVTTLTIGWSYRR
jgi:hypothetical protein